MSKNKLYYFIAEKFESIKFGFNLVQSRFQFKQTKDKKNYAFYDLSQIKQVVTDDKGTEYHLVSHHASFFETESEGNPCLSQYHYTADFYDNLNKKKYKLHVYFNKNDEVIKGPLFFLDDGKNNYLNLSDELSDFFVQLAIDKSFSVVSELKKQYYNFLNQIKNEYEKQEQQLSELSKKLTENPGQYTAHLAVIIGLLKELSDYHYDDFYTSLLRLFQAIEFALVKITENQPQLSESESREEPKKSEPEKSTNASTNSSKEIKKSPEKIIFAAEKAKQTFLSAELADAKRMEFFLDYNQKTQDALILTEDQNYTFSVKQLQQVQQLVSSSNLEGKKYLENLLLKKQYDSAKLLAKFANPVPEKLVRMALMAGNAELLNFLLSHGDFPINTFIVADDLSPVLFCFYNNKENYPKAACLSILIKYNASIVVGAKDGLPVAHHIINAAQHPLKEALNKNPDVTIGNSQFYKKLICHLNNYLKNNTVDSDTKTKLLNAIDNYQFTMKLISKKNPGAYSRQVQNVEYSLENIRKQFDEQALAEFLTDPKILAQYSRYKKILLEYNKKISSKEKLNLQSRSSKIINSLDDLVQYLDLNQPDVKEQVCITLTDWSYILELKMQLMDVQNTIRTKKYSKRMQNEAGQQQRLIMQELQPYQEKYKILDPEQSDLKETQGLAEVLKEMQEMLRMEEIMTLLDKLTVLQEEAIPLVQKGDPAALINKLEEIKSTDAMIQESSAKLTTGRYFYKGLNFFPSSNILEDDSPEDSKDEEDTLENKM